MRCETCERCTWNPGPDCGITEHAHCPKCGHCQARHTEFARSALSIQTSPTPFDLPWKPIYTFRCPNCNVEITANFGEFTTDSPRNGVQETPNG